MGLFDNLFSRKEKVETFPEFVLGVEDIFKLKNSTDLVIVGRVKGTVKPGDCIFSQIDRCREMPRMMNRFRGRRWIV